MKWYWVLLIIVLIAAAWYGYTLSQKAKAYKAELSGSLKPQNFVQTLIDSGKTLSQIKEQAKANGIFVFEDTETHTMEYNPKRVIVRVTQPECFTQPCKEIIQIVSVG